MTTSPAFKCIVIFLIPLTFAWKLVAEPPVEHDGERRIVRFLETHYFSVAEEVPVKGVPIVRAKRGDCSMIVAEGFPDGSTIGLIRHLAATGSQQFVVVNGAIYRDQPTWLTVTQDRVSSYLRKIGIVQTETPPIMVAAAPPCAAERLPWSEL